MRAPRGGLPDWDDDRREDALSAALGVAAAIAMVGIAVLLAFTAWNVASWVL